MFVNWTSLHFLRWLELVTIFICTPVLLWLLVTELNTWLMPVLVLVSLICLTLLLLDPSFKRFRLTNISAFRQHMSTSLFVFIPSSIGILLLFYFISPDVAFSLPLQHTELWVMTLLIYPVVSVLPQEIIFRTFFFHRYKGIIPNKYGRWVISTLCFALAHVVYGNWIAVILSIVAGAFFGYRYMHTRSTPIVIIEHTLWGSLLFSTGAGMYFLMQ